NYPQGFVLSCDRCGSPDTYFWSRSKCSRNVLNRNTGSPSFQHPAWIYQAVNFYLIALQFDSGSCELLFFDGLKASNHHILQGTDIYLQYYIIKDPAASNSYFLG